MGFGLELSWVAGGLPWGDAKRMPEASNPENHRFTVGRQSSPAGREARDKRSAFTRPTFPVSGEDVKKS
jgi:hypothetical protein